MSTQFELASPPERVINSVAFAPGASSKLPVGSWDGNVYLYDVSDGQNGQLVKTIDINATSEFPGVLDVVWGSDDSTAYAGGLDEKVVKIDIQTNALTELSKHLSGVRKVVFSQAQDLIISGSWDKTLHMHSVDEPDKYTKIQLPGKVYGLSLTDTKVVVGLSDRVILVYELDKIKAAHQSAHSEEVIDVPVFQVRESSLKFQLRGVCCLPDGTGFVTPSVEGRIAVDFFDPDTDRERRYAFKYHRAKPEDPQDKSEVVHSVNIARFHPVHMGTFATGGGDGSVALWDSNQKRRIRSYRFTGSVSSLAFSDDGNYLATATGPYHDKDGNLTTDPVKIVVRGNLLEEAKGKAAK